MTREMNKGMWLRRGTQTGHDPVWILNAMVATGACGGLIWIAGAVMGLWDICTPVPMLLCGCLICLLGHIPRRTGKGSYFPVTVLAVLLVLILLFRNRMTDGIALVWNRMGEIRTAGTGWVLPELAVEQGREQFSLILLSCVAGCLMGLLCTVPERVRWVLLALQMPGILLGGVVLLGRTDLTGLLWPALGASLLLLIHNGSETKGFLPTAAGWTAAALMLGLMIPVSMLPTIRQWSEAFFQEYHEAHHVKTYETGYTVLPEGDLSGESSMGSEAVPGLVVTMDQPERMFFRGFVGEQLQDDVWTALDRSVLAENRELLYWLNLKEFHPGQQFRAAVSAMEMTENTVTVQNIGACSEMYYLPFSFSGGIELPAENLNAMADNSSGDHIYIFTAVSGSANRIPEVLAHLEKSEDPAVAAYRKAESAYRAYVYENYLQIPEDVERLLKGAWDACRESEDRSPEQAQISVKRFLDLCYPAEGEAPAMELPLNAAAGTSFQRTTVEVMTLRYFGIPARYAEGYVLTAQMAAEAGPGDTIYLDSSCARSWTEIYQDGIGWIPLELTRAAEESEDQNEDDSGPGTSDENSDAAGIGTGTGLKEGMELEETVPETEPETDNTDTQWELELPDNLIRAVLVALLVLILLLLGLLIRYWILTGKREKRYNSGTENDTVAWLFADTVAVLEELGFDRGNGSVSVLYQPVSQAYGEEYAGRFREMTDLNARAMFSSKALTREQRNCAAAFREDTLEIMKKDTKWLQRLRLKWVRCLY